MISYDQALHLALEFSRPAKVEVLRLEEAFGRVLAQDLVSPFPLPRFDNSAVDGYALAGFGQDRKWRVVRTVGAGDPPGPALADGECARIFTGAPVPPRVSAVAMQEDVVSSSGDIQVLNAIKPGKNIRKAGEEVGEGAVALAAGTPLHAAGIGVAATLGLTHVPVYCLPRVGVVVTGAELASPGSELKDCFIYESNGAVLAAALQAIGIAPVFIETTGDDPESTQGVLGDAISRCDVLVTTGGVSVGDRDVVRSSLERLGVQEVFWKIAIKPGKPAYMGRKGDLTVFGLPGNPLSVLATFHLLVKPFILASKGISCPAPFRVKATLASNLDHKPGRREFVPGSLVEDREGPVVSPITGQGSHMLTGMARANVLIDIPEQSHDIGQGEEVWAVLL